jgi:hypothetical protein
MSATDRSSPYVVDRPCRPAGPCPQLCPLLTLSPHPLSPAPQAKLYPRILAAMKPGATLGLSHGFLLGIMKNDSVDFRKDINVVLVAPKVRGDDSSRGSSRAAARQAPAGPGSRAACCCVLLASEAATAVVVAGALAAAGSST